MNEKIRELFVKKMGLILDKRKNEAAQAATRVRGEMNARGMLHSSVANQRVRSTYEETYDKICGEAWSELHHIAVTVGVKPDENLVDKLRAVFDEVMEPLAKRYLGDLGKYRSTAGAIAGDIMSDAEAAFLRSRQIVGTEIELFLSNTEMVVSQSAGNVYIQNYRFSGPIGAVQQGDHSTATVTQNIDTAVLESLRSSLESLLERFRDDERLAPLNRKIEGGSGEASAAVGTHPKSAKRDQDVDRPGQGGQGALRNGRECCCKVRHGGVAAHTAVVDRGRSRRQARCHTISCRPSVNK